MPRAVFRSCGVGGEPKLTCQEADDRKNSRLCITSQNTVKMVGSGSDIAMQQ